MAAMSFFCCKSIVYIPYQFQKTTANPILDLGMVTLVKPLHVTRIRVRDLHGAKSYRSNGSCEQSATESDILELLNVNSKSKTAGDLSEVREKLAEKLAQIKTRSKLRHLYKDILDSSHIETMWNIAAHRNKDSGDSTDPILPRDTLSPEIWIGNSWKISWKISWKNKQRIWSRLTHPKRFSLSDDLEMLICRDEMGLAGVIFKGKSGLLCVEKNPEDHPEGKDVQCDFAFKFENGKQPPNFPAGVLKLGIPYQAEWNNALKLAVEKPWPDQFVVYVRRLRSNVLVGEAWKVDRKPEILRRLLLIKLHEGKM